MLAQLIMATAAIGLLLLLGTTVHHRLEAQGITSGFDFLWSRAGYDLSESLIPYSGSDSYGRALLAGFSNTLKVAVCSIVAAILIGLLAAAAQLSQHDIARSIGKFYVAVVRNTPLLLQLFFWFGVFSISMPGPRVAMEPLPGTFVSNRGIDFPWPSAGGWPIAVLALSCLAVLIVWFRYERFQGRRLALSALTLGATLGVAAIAVLSGQFPCDIPVAGPFSIRGGGHISPEFLTLFTGLSVYTGSYIAEAVRGAVLAIPKGQLEAGNSLGLRPFLVLVLIVMPQAVRIAMPAIVSELLNLVKNSSLGVAVGYPELVSAGNTAMNQTGQAIEVIAIYMLVYVSFNLIVTKVFALWEGRYAR
jgi:general L-amino acid transport system permease protein